MIIIYGTKFSSRVNKLFFLMNALEIPYEFEPIDMMAGEHKSPEYLKKHPAGKVPVMEEDGFILFESNAILKYLASKRENKFYSDDPKTRAVIDQWMDFCSHHIDTAISRVLFNRVIGPNIPGYKIDTRSLEDGIQFLARFLPIVDEQLGKYPYLAGNKMTLADFNLLAILDPAEVGKIDLSVYPSLLEWRKNLKKEDFYQNVFEDYSDVLKEGV